MQKLSEGEIHGLHEKLISRLERAIEEQKADEFEWYGLEFLGGHYPVNAMLNGDGSKLLAIAYDQNHWQRQLKFSKGYTWTKNGLREMMAWASKHNDDEVIECGLQMLDLHHQEQNAAPQIVALVAEGDFDVAIKRIEQFGGNDKEGLQRKFILYMLCLMELTLLDSKNKPFSKKGIEKLLKHLDEQLPVDHSILNWNDFFSSYLIFQMACEWEELGLDYLIVYKRTGEKNTLASYFLYKKGNITEASNLLYTAIEDAQRSNDTQEIPNIFKRLIELGQFKTIYQDIINFHKNEKYGNTIVDYIEALLKIDEIENAELLLKSFNVNNEGSKNGRDLWYKGMSLNMVFNKYVDLNKFFDSELIFKEIQSPWHKITTLTYSSKAYYKIGDFNAASIKMREADDLFKKNQDLVDIEYLIDNIVRDKLSIGQFEDAILLSERLEKHDLYGKCKMAIATELFALGRLSESLKIINKIDSQYTRSEALLEFALTLLNKGENNLFNSFLEQCEQLILTIENSNDQDAMLAKIAKGLSKNNQFFQAIKYVKLIRKDSSKGSALIQILENSDMPLKILQIEVCEEIVLSISNPELRQNFWFEIGNFFNSNFNFELPRSFIFFKNDEAEYFYILSWIKNIELEKIQKEALIYCVKKMINYPEIMETALQIYCLNDLFNVKTNIFVSNYKRFDQTLNIKWAIDIKNQLPN